MLFKVLLTAASAAALSTAAYAQAPNDYPPAQLPTTSATSPNTVNPVAPYTPVAQTGQQVDVVAISADEARARGIPVEVVASAPVPDTAANRAAYGGPLSNAGRHTAPAAN